MSTAPTIAEIREFISRLALLDGHVEEPDDSSASERNSAAGMMVGAVSADANRLELISALESVKGALAAAQARIAVAFDASERATQRAAGVPAAKLGVGIAEQVALARRESPTRGSRHLGVAKALVHEMPHTMAALTSGELSEWRATLVVQATAVLDADDRRQADARLAGRLGKLSDKQVRAAAMAIAYELDPRSVVNRAAYAVTQRRVSIRPAPDTMAHLTALLPVAQAVAVFAALNGAAGAARAAGDPRSLDQVKADTLVERVTGQVTASAVPVEIGLVMSDVSLLAGDHTPAFIPGYGPVPAAFARALAIGGGEEPCADNPSASRAGAPTKENGAPDQAQVWIRRLYLDPRSGSIADADPRRRFFPQHLRRVVVARDQWCRTPWCGAPIRHIDHALPHREAGLTELTNAAGLCERCNHAKESPGWSTSITPDELGRTLITTTTSAALVYSSTSPPWDPTSRTALENPTTPTAGATPTTGTRPTAGTGPTRPVPRRRLRCAIDRDWVPSDSPLASVRLDLATCA